MAYGLTQDDDPIFRTAQQARAGLPAYGGVNKADMPSVPALPSTRRGLTSPDEGDPEMASQGYRPVSSGPPMPPVSGGAAPDDPDMLAMGFKPVGVAPRSAPQNVSNYSNQFQSQYLGSKEMGYAALGAAARTFGANRVQDWAGENVQRLKGEQEELETPSSSFMNVWEGKEGATWKGFGAGLAGAATEVLAEGLATAAVTALAGSALGPAGTVAGGGVGMAAGVAGAVAKNAFFRQMFGKGIAFEAKRLSKQAVAEGAEITAEQVTQLAARNVLRYATIGASIDVGKNAVMGVGQVMSRAVEEAERTGQPIDMAKVYGYGLGIGMSESVGELTGVGHFLKVGKGATRLGNVGRSTLAQMITEGGTEGLQQGLELVGSGKNSWANLLTDPDARREIIDSIAAGAGIGGIIGAGGGITQRGTRSRGLQQPGPENIGEEELPPIQPGMNQPVGPHPGLQTPQTTNLLQAPGTPGAPASDIGTDAGISPLTQSQGRTHFEAQNAEMWERRNAAEQERIKHMANVSALHDQGESSGDVRTDVAAAIAEMTGAAEDVVKHMKGPPIMGAIGDAAGQLDKIAKARGLQPPTTVATDPEPASDVKAQIAALADPKHPKQTVYLAPGTALPKQLPNTVFAIPKEDGIYLTNDEGTRDTIVSLPGGLTEGERAMFLGIPDAKPVVLEKAARKGKKPVAVVAKDKDGNVVAGAVTDEVASPNTEAVATQTPADGSLVVQTPEDALEERSTKLANETAVAPVTEGAAPRTVADIDAEIKSTMAAQKAETDPAKRRTLGNRVKVLLDEMASAQKITEPPAATKATEAAAPNTAEELLANWKPTNRKDFLEGIRQIGEALNNGDVVYNHDQDDLTWTIKKSVTKHGTEVIKFISNFGPKGTFWWQRKKGETEWTLLGDVGLAKGFVIDREGKLTAEREAAEAADATTEKKADTPAATKAKETSKRLAKEKADAVQVEGTAGVLQQPPKGTGGTRRKRGGVEQEQQRQKPAAQDQADTEKGGKGEVAPTETVAGIDWEDRPATLRLWHDGGVVTRAEIVQEDGTVMPIATKEKDTINSVVNRVSDEFTPGSKLAEETEEGDEGETEKQTLTREEKRLRKAAERNAAIKKRAERVKTAARRMSSGAEAQTFASEEEHQRFVNASLSTDWGQGDHVRFVAVPDRYAQFVQRVAELFGQNVQFFVADNKEFGRATNGFQIEGDPHTVFVNVDTKKPAMWVVGHEIGHNIREMSPVLWRTFMEELKPLVNRKEFEKYLHGLKVAMNKEAARRGEGKADINEVGATAQDEVSSDSLGEAFMDPKFWDMLYRAVDEDKKPLVYRVMQEVQALMRRMAEAWSQFNDPQSKTMFNDMRAVNRAVRDLLVDFRTLGPEGDTHQDQLARAGAYYDAKMEPDPEEGQVKWKDLSDDGKERWLETYGLHLDEWEIDDEAMLKEFLHINEVERVNRIVDRQAGAAAQTKARREAGEMWDGKLAKASDPDFEDLSPEHKNYFIREAFKKDKPSPSAAYDQIMAWRAESEKSLSAEDKRTTELARATAKAAKERDKKAAADAKVAAKVADEHRRLALVKAAVEKDRPAINERMENLRPTEEDALTKFFGENYEQKLRKLVNEVLADPKSLVRTVDASIKPVVRRIVGGVKYSRAVMGEYGAEAENAALEAATDTAAFKTWFRNSKVVEENGEPMRLYHGTDRDIQEFKLSKEGALGAGIYLTPNSEFASGYANREGGNVVPVFASLQNPLILRHTTAEDPMRIALIQLGMSEDKAEALVERAYEEKGYITGEVKSRAQKAGYDGLMQYRDGKLMEVVAFQRESVKSVFNQSFNPYDARISYSRTEVGTTTREEDAALRAATREQTLGRVEPKITSTGKIVGAPPGKNTRTDRERLVAKLTKLMEHPYAMFEKSKTWYEDSGRDIARLTKGNPALQEALIRLTAYYSQGVQVGANTTFTIRAMYQMLSGANIHSGIYPNVQSPIAEKILQAKDMNTSLDGVDNKLMNFYRNLKDATTGDDQYDNASTLDRWMMRIFGYKHSEDEDVGGSQSMSTPQYEYGKNVMHRVAKAWEKKTGEKLKQRQVQAVLWTYEKNKNNYDDLLAQENTLNEIIQAHKEMSERMVDEGVALPDKDHAEEMKFHRDLAAEFETRRDKVTKKIETFEPATLNYADYFERASARVLYEVRPSTSLDIWPAVQSMTRAQLRKFSDAIHSVLRDPDTGRDLLMQKTGLYLNRQARGTGSWAGELSPNFLSYALQDQTVGFKPTDAEKAEGVKPIKSEWIKAQVNNYADALGYLLRQDSVFWFRPSDTGPEQGVTARFPNPTADVEDRLYSEIRAVTPHIELTRDGNEVFFVNTAIQRDAKGEPILDAKGKEQKILTDHTFKRIVTTAVDNVSAKLVGDTEIGTFRTEANFHSNDWTKDRNGESYRSRLVAAGRSDLLPWLDGKRREIDSIASSYTVGGRVKYSRAVEEDGSQQAEAGGVRDGRGVRGGDQLLDAAAGAQYRPPPIQGLPTKVRVGDKLVEFGPHEAALRAAQRYMETLGRDAQRPSYEKLNRLRARQIADAYHNMQHVPHDPVVREAYTALKKELLGQWKAMKATGVNVEFTPGDDPYGNPRNAILDVVNNNHLWIFPTDSGHGENTTITDEMVAGNPLLEMSGVSFNGVPARYNDLFRAVHDFFGHVKEGIGFRAEGEDNAWRQHAAMFSPTALRALTTETRGQNSWVNFGPHGEHNQTANGATTKYAEQKVGLMPLWTQSDAPVTTAPKVGRVSYSRKDTLNPVEVYAMKGDKAVGMATWNVPNQRWIVFKSINDGDIRDDYSEHSAATTEEAHDMLRGKGVRLVRRKASPQMRGQNDVLANSRRPEMLYDIDISPKPGANRFTRSVDAILNKLGAVGKGGAVRRYLVRQGQDAYVDLRVLQDDLTTKGGNISVDSNVYRKITLYAGVTGAKLDTFKRTYVDPIEKWVGEVIKKGGTLKDVEAYLRAEHAEERNDNIFKKTAGKVLDGSGITTKVAKDRMRFYEAKPYAAELKEISKLADSISEFKVNTMLESGLIDADTAAGLRSYKHYRPMKGLDDEVGDDTEHLSGGMGVGMGFSGKTSLLKYALGRDKESNHTIAHMLLDAEAKIVRAGKNTVQLGLIKLAEDHPDEKFWNINLMKTRKVWDAEKGTIRYQSDNDLNNPNTIVAYQNGQPIKIELMDDTFAQAMVGTANSGSNALVEVMRRFNKIMGMLMTSLNPEWGLINAGRDAQTAFFNMQADSSLPPGVSKKAMKDLLTLSGSHRDIYRAITDPTHPAGFGVWYKDLEARGGITKFFALDTLKDRANKLAGLEDRILGRGFKGAIGKAYRGSLADKAVTWLEDMNATIEAAPRVLAYKALVEAGWDRDRAADYVKNLTVDFNRKGASNLLSASYLFFNPSVQGTKRIYEALQTPAGKKIATTLFGMGIVAGFIGNGSGDDDDNETPDYQQISDWDRATNIILWPHGPKIPLPYGWNAFYAMGNFITDAFFGRSPMSSVFAGVKAGVSAFNPIGGADSKSMSGWLLKTIFPTISQPLIGLAMNENRFGSQIARESDTRFGAKQPASEMGKVGTTATSKFIARTLNSIGGSAADSGPLDFNPDYLDFIAGSLAPGIPTTLARGVSTAKKWVTGEEIERREVPVVRRVLSDTSKGKIWEDLGDAKKQVGELMNIQKNGTPEEKQQLSNKYPGWQLVAATFQSLGKQAGDLQKRKAQIVDGKLTVTDDTAEVRRIDEAVMRLNNQMLKTYHQKADHW